MVEGVEETKANLQAVRIIPFVNEVSSQNMGQDAFSNIVLDYAVCMYFG